MTDKILLAVISIPLILYLPGYFVSLVFFKQDEIDLIERIALSVGLSLTIVPLTVFITNLMGIPISTVSVAIHAIVIILSAIIICQIQYRMKKHEKSQT